MLRRLGFNETLNFVGGLLVAYGFVAQLCFFLLLDHWEKVLPKVPNSTPGYVFEHSEHGAISYFSGFEGVSCTILFFTSVPIAFLGVFLMPKKNFIALRADRNDPNNIQPYGLVSGAIAALLIIFVVGPPFVRLLNSVGVVIGF